MAQVSSLTPMFRQYRALKQRHPDAILLFRMGDFYEMFWDDAREASRLLELTLTARGKGTDNVVPMCGFPHHQLESYTARLVRAGHRVAVCDQVEDPRTAKGLVRREVVRIVTPGTVTDPGQLEARDNAWIAALASASGHLGAAFLDASTGEFLAWQQGHDGDAAWDALADRLGAFGPKEIVAPEGFPWSAAFRRDRAGTAVLTTAEPFAFSPPAARDLLKRHFGVGSLDGFGLRDRDAAVAAAGGLLAYLQETLKSGLEHVDAVVVHEPARHLLLDPATRRNLEIDRSLRAGGRAGTLLDAVDATVTAAGGRLLRRWLLAPLLDAAAITRRLDAVEEFVRRADLRAGARERLKGIHDIERLVGRAVAGTANARDLLALRSSLERLPDLARAVESASSPLARETLDRLDPCADLAARLAAGLADDPPAGLKEGGVIRDRFHAELDGLRSIRRDGRSYIASLEAREREATGIASLKVRFNKVFGYYIEVTKPNLHLVPADRYHRKQTIANGERFVTPELKEHEAKVLNAQERIESLEYELFCGLRSEVAEGAPRLKAAARTVALLDVLSGLAETAARHEYCRPRLHEEPSLRIVAGRHPVVERGLVDTRFVPNDTALDGSGAAISILTGPNMGGKSTYLRQVGLIVLLAQAGSFVPAEEVEIGLVDRIFCRVGASDSLSEGQSTFMVEMTETANILHHATRRSLVLLDEIGRGTATFDGLSIAWAVVEHLHGRPGTPPRTLFATHYHELTELAVQLQGVVNHRMSVREWGERVIFLHRVEPGPADRSYGIQVARLAGVPTAVIERAKEILTNLERDEFGRDGLPRRARRRSGAAPARPQLPLFGTDPQPPASKEPADPAAAEVLAELRAEDPDRLTPLEALERLSAWRRRLVE
jgi:DNA mismatch repair protein MutS